MFATLSVCLLIPGITLADDSGDIDRETLQGTWVVVALQREGKEEKPEGFASRVRFDGDGMTWEGPLKAFTRAYRLVPGHTPKRIDFGSISGEVRGGPGSGIFELEDDTLKLCIGSTGRPTAFETGPGSGTLLYVLEREKDSGAGTQPMGRAGSLP